MVSRDEIQAYSADDKQAEQQADLGGKRPKLHPAHAAIFTAIGVFSLLDLFAAVTLPNREAAFWPVVIFTAVCSGGAATIQWWRDSAWWKRYHRAMSDIQAAKPRT